MNAGLGAARFSVLEHFVFLIKMGVKLSVGSSGSLLTIGSVANKPILLLGRQCWHPWQYGTFPGHGSVLLTSHVGSMRRYICSLGCRDTNLGFQHRAKARTGCGVSPFTMGFGGIPPGVTELCS